MLTQSQLLKMCSLGNHNINVFSQVTYRYIESRFEGSDQVVSRMRYEGALYVLSLSERLLIACFGDHHSEVYSVHENGTIFYERSNYWSARDFCEHLGIAIIKGINSSVIECRDFRGLIKQDYEIDRHANVMSVCRNCLLIKSWDNNKPIKLIRIIKLNKTNKLEFSEEIINDIDASCEEFCSINDQFFVFIDGLNEERVIKTINIDTLECKQHFKFNDYDRYFGTCQHSVLRLHNELYQFDPNTITFSKIDKHDCGLILPLAQESVDKIRQLLTVLTNLPSVCVDIIIDYLNLDYLKKIEKKYIKY